MANIRYQLAKKRAASTMNHPQYNTQLPAYSDTRMQAYIYIYIYVCVCSQTGAHSFPCLSVNNAAQHLFYEKKKSKKFVPFLTQFH